MKHWRAVMTLTVGGALFGCGGSSTVHGNDNSGSGGTGAAQTGSGGTSGSVGSGGTSGSVGSGGASGSVGSGVSCVTLCEESFACPNVTPSSESCSDICAGDGRLAAAAGCPTVLIDALNCLAATDVCGDSTQCESIDVSLSDCFLSYCDAHPTDQDCAPFTGSDSSGGTGGTGTGGTGTAGTGTSTGGTSGTGGSASCAALCDEAQACPNATVTDCATACATDERLVLTAGCSSSWNVYLACLSVTDICADPTAACNGQATSFASCILAFCQANPANADCVAVTGG